MIKEADACLKCLVLNISWGHHLGSTGRTALRSTKNLTHYQGGLGGDRGPRVMKELTQLFFELSFWVWV